MSNNKDSNNIILDGKVRNKSTSSYIENQVERKNRRPRILIAVLFTITLLSFIWGSISQYKLQSKSNEIAKIDQLKDKLNQSQSVADQAHFFQDSLENIIYKLRAENDILSENTEPPTGIFFEVQIGGFRDFNLDAYNKNLTNIRQYRHDGKTQFLLGRFRSFKKAVLFESDIKRIGIKNAYIVGRIDDKIVTYQEALDIAKQSNK